MTYSLTPDIAKLGDIPKFKKKKKVFWDKKESFYLLIEFH